MNIDVNLLIIPEYLFREDVEEDLFVCFQIRGQIDRNEGFLSKQRHGTIQERAQTNLLERNSIFNMVAHTKKLPCLPQTQNERASSNAHYVRALTKC